MDDIDFIKWWGAIVATIALSWNIYNSLSNAPKIKVSTLPNIGYPDGRILKEEKTDNGVETSRATYTHIEITNVGKQSATITRVEGTHTKKKGEMQLFSTGVRFPSHSEKDFPFMLVPGEMWSCRFEMEEVKQLAQYGVPLLKVYLAHKNKPKTVKLKTS